MAGKLSDWRQATLRIVCVAALAMAWKEAGARVTWAKEPAARSIELVAATYNIRFANPADGPDAWPERKQDVARLIEDRQVDVLGLQEALLTQLRDLEPLLPMFSRFGVGRDDGAERGEFSPILYRRDRWRVVEGSTRWLSETPQVPGSKSWDAAITRIATRCVLEPLGGGQRFVVYNTHFDHRGVEARLESAKLLGKWVGEESLPCVVMGDFNCTSRDDPYRQLTAVDASRPLVDSRVVSAETPSGPDSTWNGFREIQPGQRIDHVFVSREWRVRTHATDDRRTTAGRFPSDHLPVIVRIVTP